MIVRASYHVITACFDIDLPGGLNLTLRLGRSPSHVGWALAHMIGSINGYVDNTPDSDHGALHPIGCREAAGSHSNRMS